MTETNTHTYKLTNIPNGTHENILHRGLPSRSHFCDTRHDTRYTLHTTHQHSRAHSNWRKDMVPEHTEVTLWTHLTGTFVVELGGHNMCRIIIPTKTKIRPKINLRL